MLDVKYIVENLDKVQRNCLVRNAKADIKRVAELYQRQKSLKQQIDVLRQEQSKGEKEALADYKKDQQAFRTVEKGLEAARSEFRKQSNDYWADMQGQIASTAPSKPTVEFPSFREWLQQKDPDLLRSLSRFKRNESEYWDTMEAEIASMGPSKPTVEFPSFRDWLQENHPDFFVRNPKERIASLEADLETVATELNSLLLTIPNMSHPDAPVGTTAGDNKAIKRWGEPRKFDFAAKDHVALAEALDLADFEAGSAVAGPKFYFLKNEAVLLELALVQYAMNTLSAAGYTPVITPDLAKVDVLEGIGFIPRGPETQIYSIANSDLCLIATAEITLGGMQRDKILDESQLPQKYVGLSHCFRTEAGAPGRDTRGLFRVHQFTKVEMFAFCLPEQSEAIHLELLGLEEKIFQGLGLPYHVIDTCTGDLGGPAYRKYDLEAWMPGRGQGGEYAEVTSTSNCTDFQARRLNIRYKSPKHKGTRFVHTLNGTAVAVSRALVAILENGQQADGSVVIPEVLRPWLGGKERIGAAAP